MAPRSGVRGDRELIANFKRLSQVVGGGQIDVVALDALKPLVEEISNRAEHPALKTGAVAVKRPNYKPKTRNYWVAFRRGLAMRIAHLVEFGTQPHSMAKGASVRRGLLQDRPPWSPGTPPKPFVRPAFEATKDRVMQRFASGLWTVLTSSIGRK